MRITGTGACSPLLIFLFSQRFPVAAMTAGGTKE